MKIYKKLYLFVTFMIHYQNDYLLTNKLRGSILVDLVIFISIVERLIALVDC